MRTRTVRGRAVGSRHRRLAGVLTCSVLVPVLLLGGSQASVAVSSPVFSVSSVSVTVVGNRVDARAVIAATPSTPVSSYSVCLRSASNANLDYWHRFNSTLSSTGTTFTQSKVLAPGIYRYFVCVQYANAWRIVGPQKYFTVLTATAVKQTGAVPPTPTASAGPAPIPPKPAPVPPPTGSSMPVGNLPGWKQIMAEDFGTAAARSSFASSEYGSTYLAYSGFADTSKRGWYDSSIVSANNGALDWYVNTSGGKHRVATLVVKNPVTGWGQTYGRYSIRFRSDTLPGYKLAFMLWPSDNNWGEGEIDFPEANLLTPDNKLFAALHPVVDPSSGQPGASKVMYSGTSAADGGWHVATIDWYPGHVDYYLDGVKYAGATVGVPTTSMRLTLQVETALYGAAPADSVAGHVQVDWVTMYSRAS